jgi:hypothetical protein
LAIPPGHLKRWKEVRKIYTEYNDIPRITSTTNRK